MLSKVSVAEFIDLAICTPARKAMLAVGEFGIGKTQVIRQIGEKLGLKVICFDCTHLNDVGDILGLPSIVNGKTVFNPTYWYEPNTPVLLFFDEVFRANPDVRNALMSLCLDQTIADKKLAPGSRVFAAANLRDSTATKAKFPTRLSCPATLLTGSNRPSRNGTSTLRNARSTRPSSNTSTRTSPIWIRSATLRQ